MIATKFGFGYAGRKSTGPDSCPDRIRAVCEGSLCRPGVVVIDLFYQHRIDSGVPIKGVPRTVRDFGMSEPGAATLLRADGVQPVTAPKNEYSPWTRGPEANGSLATCDEPSIGMAPFGPLGKGFLTGTIGPGTRLNEGDLRRTIPRVAPETIDGNLALVDLSRRVTFRTGATPAKIALAWLLAQRPSIVPIPGMTRAHRLLENRGSAEMTLEPGYPARIEAADGTIPIKGARYNDAALRAVALQLPAGQRRQRHHDLRLRSAG